MTLVEFLAQLKKPNQRDQCLAVLYYLKRYEAIETATVERIRTGLKQARAKNASKMNIAAVLAGSGELVDTKGSDGNRLLWAITDTGEQHVRGLLDLPAAEPEVEHDVSKLNALARKIADAEVRDYVEEAIKCLQVGALRAAIVFLWTAAIRMLHEDALGRGRTVVNAAIQKQDKNAREIRSIDDFGYIKDRKFLDATPDIGILDKGEKDTLVEALNLRNRCGHPTKYKPRESKARSFIEDVVGIVFQ